MRDAVIVEAVRTPVGKRNGGLSGVHPVDLSAHVLRALAERAGIDPALVDDVIWGCVAQVGEQTFDIAPQRGAGRGLAGDRARRDGRPAVRLVPAGGALRGGRRDRRPVRRGGRRRGRVDEPGADGLPRSSGAEPVRRRSSWRATTASFPNQGIGAEMIAERWGLSPHPARRVLARLAREGGRRPGRGPVRRADRAGDDARRRPGRAPTRASAAAARWRRWPGSSRRSRTDGVITAGNSSQICDGAAALLMTTSEKAARARPDADRPGAHRRAGRRRPGHHADRADPGHPQGAGPQRAVRSTRSARSRSTRRSRRCRWPGWPRPAPTRRR